MKETHEEFEPGLSEMQVEPEAEVQVELTQAAEALSDAQGDVEHERQQYEAAREKMTSKIRELRASLKFRMEHMQDDEERRQLVEGEAASLAATFSQSEQLSVLKKLLPNRAQADTAREKFGMIIELGLDLSYWSRDNFQYVYDKKFGQGAERTLDAEADELRDAFLREFPELEEMDEAA